jgi:hypothetical protein
MSLGQIALDIGGGIPFAVVLSISFRKHEKVSRFIAGMIGLIIGIECFIGFLYLILWIIEMLV